MTEITLDVLIDEADDFMRNIGADNKLLVRTLFVTKRGESENYRVIVMANESGDLRALLQAIALAQDIDQMLMVTECDGYQLADMTTADIMRISHGKAETAEELSNLVTDGTVPMDSLSPWRMSVVSVIGQSVRNHANRYYFQPFKVEGERPHRRFIPMDDMEESGNTVDTSFDLSGPGRDSSQLRTNIFPMLFPNGIEDLSREQKIFIGQAALAIATQPHLKVHGSPRLYPGHAARIEARKDENDDE